MSDWKVYDGPGCCDGCGSPTLTGCRCPDPDDRHNAIDLNTVPESIGVLRAELARLRAERDELEQALNHLANMMESHAAYPRSQGRFPECGVEFLVSIDIARSVLACVKEK